MLLQLLCDGAVVCVACGDGLVVHYLVVFQRALPDICGVHQSTVLHGPGANPIKLFTVAIYGFS